MWRSSGKAGTVFFVSFSHPLKWAPPPKGGVPKMRQNSKFLKKLFVFFIFVYFKNSKVYGEAPEKLELCFLQVLATPLKWAPPPKGGGGS